MMIVNFMRVNPHFVLPEKLVFPLNYLNSSKKIWFYLHYYESMSQIITTIDPKYHDRALITTDRWKINHGINPDHEIRSSVYITHFKYAYLSYNCSTELGGIRLTNKDYNGIEHIKTVGYVDTAVGYYQHFWQYGHAVHDFFGAIVHVPEDVMKRGFYVVPPLKYKEKMQEMFDFLQLNIKMLPMKRDEQYFCHDLYLTNSLLYVHGTTISGMLRIRKLVFDKLNNTFDKATRYVVLNRPEGEKRRFTNEKEILKALNAITRLEPGKEWELVSDDVKSLDRTLKLWMTFRVLVAPQGSMINNNIFMAEGTGMCLMFTSMLDQANSQLAILSNQFMIGVIHPEMDRANTEEEPADSTRMAEYAQMVVEAVQIGHWKYIDKEELIPVFPYKDVTKKFPDNEFTFREENEEDLIHREHYNIIFNNITR